MSESKRIGQLLLEAGLISEQQLAEALERQTKEGGRVCSQLLRLGHLGPDDLLDFLSRQFGVAAVNLSSWRIPGAVLGLVPVEVARRIRVVPVNVLDRTLTVAMENPRDIVAVEEVERVTGLTVEPLIVPQAVMEEALQRYYSGDTVVPPPVAEHKVLVMDERADRPEVYDSTTTVGDLSAVNVLKRVVFLGIKRRSREIHVEPREDETVVRYRVGSRLVNGEGISKAAAAGAMRVLMDHAGLDPDARGPRDGWVRVRVRARELKLAFSTFPVLHGERLVMRLVDEGQFKRSLGDLGMDQESEGRLLNALDRKQGILLVASPVAQERRWVLYQLLGMLRSDSINVFTVEPWILFPVPGISQTLYSRLPGEGQVEVLKAGLRQEPDVVGVADLDSREALEIVSAASLRCLVIGTVPHEDALGALAWLGSFHENRLSIAHLLDGIVALRLLPRLCPSCRKPLGDEVGPIPGVRDIPPEKMRFWEAPGCDRCERTGRAGQMGIFEVLLPDADLRTILAEGTPPRVVYEEAQRRGMRTLLEEGIRAAVAGEVDVRDALRAAPSIL